MKITFCLCLDYMSNMLGVL